MSNYDFLKKYQRLQDGIMFDELKVLDFASVGFSKTDKSSYWNLALVNRLLDVLEIEKVETILSNANRTTTFYFENRNDLKSLMAVLEERKYKKSFEDTWQFWKNGISQRTTREDC